MQQVTITHSSLNFQKEVGGKVTQEECQAVKQVWPRDELMPTQGFSL